MTSATNLRHANDLPSALLLVLSESEIKYKGCTIKREGSTFVWAKKCHPNLDAAKRAIDNAATLLATSLNRA